MRRAVCAACVTVALVAPLTASGDARCTPGAVRPCSAPLPAGMTSDTGVFTGERVCVVGEDGRARESACHLVPCEGESVRACKRGDMDGLAQCTALYSAWNDRADLGYAFGECGGVRECKPFERFACPGPSMRADHEPHRVPCVLERGVWRFARAACATPLVLDFDGETIGFTRAPGTFAIGGEATEWVDAGAALLAVDLDDDGVVDDETELFGTATGRGAFTNGFEALAAFDDDRDGRITPRDAIWSKLRVWRDANQDRASSPDELTTLERERVGAIDLAYASRAPRASSYEGEVGSFTFSRDGENRAGRVVDVHFAPL